MSQDQVKQFIDQASQSIQSGQFEGALQLIDQALALSPNDADAHILRGICLSQTGQPIAATDAFNRAITLDPASAKARYNMAVHLYAQGQKSEALTHARAAADLDATHAGARQLINTIDSELRGPAPHQTPNYNDPLATPPQSAPPVTPAPPIPQPNPYAANTGGVEAPRTEPSMPAPPPTPHVPTNVPPVSNPYAKPAYSGPTHSIPFVENLGSTWVGIGWFLAALSLVGFIAGVIVVISAFGQGNFNDPNSFEQAMNRQGGIVLLSQIAGYGSTFGIIVWSIMDLIDRRGNMIWLLPNILCSCCGFGWITLPIYLLAGRNN
jgi:tetratricopeptide (TPR) repeat protein